MAITENSYQAGNTVRLHCTFTNFSGVPTDPSVIKVRVYDQKYNLIKDNILSSDNRDDVGVYFFDYTIPMDFVNQKIVYEWYGEIGGYPSLSRGKFKVIFI
jgi:hypothetical protein